MATHIVPPDFSSEAARREFEAMQHAYLHSSCVAFAAAMHQITGWEIIALDAELTHVGVRNPDGTIWDARGPVTPDEFVEPFGDNIPEEFPIVSREHLRGACPGIDYLPAAQRHASRMFPKLPHLPTSDRSRNLAFMDAVEELGRRRGYWIVAQQRSSLTTWPIVSEAFGEEVGYRATNTNGDHTLDRMLVSQQVRGPSHLSRELERFLCELAELSKQHELWIRAGLPTTWPRIIRLDPRRIASGARYVMRQTDNAGGFAVTLD